jgi:hypothetical protein
MFGVQGRTHGMSRYRLYFLDKTGRIAHALDLHCESDDEALELVEARRDGRPMELWHSAQLIRKFPAAPPPATP